MGKFPPVKEYQGLGGSGIPNEVGNVPDVSLLMSPPNPNFVLDTEGNT